MNQGSIPVTILSGNLGAGKTTTLNHLLSVSNDTDIAVLVNDMGEINIDAELLEGGTEIVADEGVAELSNGCICCELQDDLRTEVSRLAREWEFDTLVVEASGISEPAPIARLFTTESRVAARYDVDATVTVVSARQFRDFFEPGAPVERTETEDGEVRPLSDLVIEQIEFCDVLLLNKCDLVDDDRLDEIEATLRALQPRAELIRTEHGRVSPDRVLQRGLFDLGAVSDSAGWKQAMEHADGHDGDHHHDSEGAHGRGHDHNHDHNHDHRHPQEAFGITSVSYRATRPLHPARLHDFFASLPDGIVRAKGTFWVAGRDDVKLEYGQAGSSARVTVAGAWIASLPEIDQDLYRSNRSASYWDEEWGDRRTQLVFIGTDVDEDTILAALDDCVLTDDEMDADWNAFDDPFPSDEDGLLTYGE
ncbi:cobalamin biosynthesis protein CobW [Haladaptatus sp. R4]|uniref:GTP-binding protein n=1 Tax=Haladaptatus sp. R4 TaxID=1679489 RepID=UPI0007B4D527|nr:GTP-binding protein [Haladaptatus sp. R4]KZN25001.1 cobalamin biosynthesis protein CobW [Haladaptatus sp. R4]